MKFDMRKPKSNQSSSPVFLRLKDGESVRGVFRGDLYKFYTKWINGASQAATPDDPEAKARYRVNFVLFDKDQNKFVAKIFEMSQPTQYDLADLAQSLKDKKCDLQKTKVLINRKGTQRDTRYTLVSLGEDEPISPAVLQQIEAVPLNILDANRKKAPAKDADGFPPGFSDPPMPDEQELPF